MRVRRRWEIALVKKGDPGVVSPINEYLADGWEPFAAIDARVWLRRRCR